MPKSISVVPNHKQTFYRYLDTNGNGTGTKNANLEFASPDIFYIQPPSGTIYYLNRMIISVGDTTGMTSSKYGNLAELGTGITFKVVDDSGTILDLTDGIPVDTNASYGALCYDVDVKTWGSGNELLVTRWTFAKAGNPLKLRGSKNERLEVDLSDDMSALLSQYFLVQGWVD